MFPSTPESPGVGPALDVFQEWRRAAQGVVRTYKEWCASNWPDRHQLYLSFLDALGREEQAALRLELNAEALVSKGDRS